MGKEKKRDRNAKLAILNGGGGKVEPSEAQGESIDIEAARTNNNNNNNNNKKNVSKRRSRPPVTHQLKTDPASSSLPIPPKKNNNSDDNHNDDSLHHNHRESKKTMENRPSQIRRQQELVDRQAKLAILNQMGNGTHQEYQNSNENNNHGNHDDGNGTETNGSQSLFPQLQSESPKKNNKNKIKNADNDVNDNDNDEDLVVTKRNMTGRRSNRKRSSKNDKVTKNTTTPVSASTTSAVEVRATFRQKRAKQEAKLRTMEDHDHTPNTTVSLLLEDSEKQLPGAYADNGLRSSDLHSDVDNLLSTTNEHDVIPTRQPQELYDHSININEDKMLPQASMVDDAEAIVYAEDVQKDMFRRKIIFCSFLVVIVCAIVFGVVFGGKDPIVAPIETTPTLSQCTYQDKRCCAVPIEEMELPKSIPFRCHCFNTTEGIYSNLTAESLVYYQTGKELLDFFGLVNSEEFDEIDPNTSCDPNNQVLLTWALHEEGGGGETTLVSSPGTTIRSFYGLVHFYIANKGYDWVQSGGWLENLDFCNWFGINCAFLDRIDEIAIPNNLLRGKLSPVLGIFKTLHSLDFSANDKLQGPLPSEITRISNLNYLDFSSVPLNQTLPPWLGNSMPQLERIDFRNTQLYGDIPPSLGNLSNLSWLRLASNSLTGTLPEEMAGLIGLKLLDLGLNQFSGTIPDFIGLMPSLEAINLKDSGFTGTFPQSFCNLETNREVLLDCDVIDTSTCSCCSDKALQNPLVVIRCAQDVV